MKDANTYTGEIDLARLAQADPAVFGMITLVRLHLRVERKIIWVQHAVARASTL